MQQVFFYIVVKMQMLILLLKEYKGGKKVEKFNYCQKCQHINCASRN